MRVRQGIAVSLLVSACGLPAGVASAQTPSSAFKAHEQDNADGPNFDGARPTAPAVGVNNVGVVVAGTRFMMITTKNSPIFPVDIRSVDSTMFPYRRASVADTRFIDPRAAYDGVQSRLWTAYLEAEVVDPFLINHCGEEAWLHLGVSQAGAPFGPFALDQWWYHTDMPGASPTDPKSAINLADPDYHQYKETENIHRPLNRTARMPSLGFLTPSGEAEDRNGALIVAVNARIDDEGCGAVPPDGTNGPPVIAAMGQFIYIFPYEQAGGALSILDGDPVVISQSTVVRMFVDDDQFIAEDTSVFGCVVQAPYEQPENAVLIISTPRPPGVMEHIRLKGIYDDKMSSGGVQWTLQQRTTGATPLVVDDVLLDAPFRYRSTNQAGAIPVPILTPSTPDTLLSWGPAAQGTFFHSAVLAKDVNGDFRVFAVHAVLPESTSDDRWVVQWYVIDPKLDDFQSSTPGIWQPDIARYGNEEIKAIGRLEGQGHSYHPVIVVNRQGQAFIEYTYSDSNTWPQVRRVRLNSGYNGIVGNPSIVRPGSPQPYEEFLDATVLLGSWANTADAQADPFNSCAYWSTHTLVNDLVDNVPDPTTEKRDVWLFHQAYANSVGPLCLQTLSMLDLNDDGVVDAFDMAALTDLYARGARRIDLNADGVTDRHDLELYMAAYDEYTRR